MHVWDTRTDTLVQSFPGHKDAITGKFKTRLPVQGGSMQVFASELKGEISRLQSHGCMTYTAPDHVTKSSQGFVTNLKPV